MRKVAFWILGILSTLIGLYPAIYLLNNGSIGLLENKSQILLDSIIWQTSFYGHIVPGGIALLIGWVQFNTKLRSKQVMLHRLIGRIYVVTALVSGFCGIYLGIYAEGGLVSKLGFTSLGLVWAYTTFMGLMAIINGKVDNHMSLMIYSYAVCFAAVSLRLWMPILIFTFQDPSLAFKIVSWWCWIPNLIVAHFLIPSKKLPNLNAKPIA